MREEKSDVDQRKRQKFSSFSKGNQVRGALIVRFMVKK